MDRFQDVLESVKYKDWKFEVIWVGGSGYLQVSFDEKCAKSGETKTQKSRKWALSLHMTKSEIVQTAFKAVMTAEEHEIREKFKYRGENIFGPHFDVDKLVSFSRTGALDVRQ